MSNPSHPDIAIIGAGIVGLWCAKYACDAGLRVRIFDPNPNAQSASYGIVGALMPHQPNDWSPKKALQLRGLTTLPKYISALESETGLTAGYRRTGRLMRINSSEERKRHQKWGEDANTHWRNAFGTQEQSPKWTVCDISPQSQWLANESSPHGYALDELTARLEPRAMINMLRVWLAARGILTEPMRIIGRNNGSKLNLSNGESIAPKHCIIAAGHASFPMLTDWTLSKPLGQGVKGQAALIKPKGPISPDMPILFDQGLYVIAHENGLISVGSTSENSWSNDTGTDEKLDDLIARAKQLCPALQDATIVERWSGIRAKADTRKPLVGLLPDHANLVIATGGFKITFGIAHLMAEAAIGNAIGNPATHWPDDFRPSAKTVSL